MNLSSMTRKFKSKAGVIVMQYLEKYALSKDAAACFNVTIKGLLEKAKRERRVPDKYLFFIEQSGMDATIRELIDAGCMTYKFTENGQDVYEHEVDKDLLRQVLGWNTH